ncbi:hemicentin-1 [Dermatophagoides farinae]|uniref:Hemicentin-1 n=1 Tax=Dermatophagoides farinae TaxID=6954 RepID=A0A9D4NUG5_DERFA|nr:hemicentin-1 [Dermatophagoides farinae]
MARIEQQQQQQRSLNNDESHNYQLYDEIISQIIIADQQISSHSSTNHRQINQLHTMEGQNITMDCLFRAKPNATVIRWSHNHDEIWQEKSGIEIERNRLRIINAQAQIHSGLYRCIVFNSEGRGLSNEIKIFVDCKYSYINEFIK